MLQLSPEDSSYLLALIGFGNTIGRIVLGYVTLKPWVNRLYIYISCLLICGIGKFAYRILYWLSKWECMAQAPNLFIFLFQKHLLVPFFALTFNRWPYMRLYLDSQSVKIWINYLQFVNYVDAYNVLICRCSCWIDIGNSRRFAGNWEAYQCIWFIVAVSRHWEFHWPTNSWFYVRSNPIIYTQFSICWYDNDVKWINIIF